MKRTIGCIAVVGLASFVVLAGCNSQPKDGGAAGLPGASSSYSSASPGAVSSKDVVSFKVEGMACPNCAKHVSETLAALPGVKGAQVNFDTKMATVTLDSAKPASMKQLQDAVAAWHKEHFSAAEDPECLDPAKRKEMQKQGG